LYVKENQVNGLFLHHFNRLQRIAAGSYQLQVRHFAYVVFQQLQRQLFIVYGNTA
jgi:hypothetical protein